MKIGGQNIWLWDIICSESRYLLASRLSTSRTTRDAQILMERAKKTAGKSPKAVVTDKLGSYLDVDYGKDTEHRQGSPFATDDDSTSRIERWHGTIKSRTKVMRGLKNLETAHDFVEGFLAFYNYLRPHEALNDKTPAEVAGIAYPYKNWNELIRNYKPSHKIEILHVERGTMRLHETHIGRSRKARITSRAKVPNPLSPKFPIPPRHRGRITRR